MKLFFNIFYICLIVLGTINIFIPINISKLLILPYILIAFLIIMNSLVRRKFLICNFEIVKYFLFMLMISFIISLIKCEYYTSVSYAYLFAYIIFVFLALSIKPLDNQYEIISLIKLNVRYLSILALLSCIAFLVSGEYNFFNVVNAGNSVSKNMIGFLFFIGYVFSMVLQDITRNKLYFLYIFLFLSASLLVFSRSVFLAISIFTFLHNLKNITARKIVILFLCGSFLVGAIASSSHFQRRLGRLDVTRGTGMLYEGNNFIRTALALSGVKVFTDNIIFGVGIGNQQVKMLDNLTELNFLTDSQISFLKRRKFGGHNMILRLLDEYGIFAILFFIFISKIYFSFSRNTRLNNIVKLNFKILFGLMILLSFTNDILLSSIFFIFIIFFIKVSSIKKDKEVKLYAIH